MGNRFRLSDSTDRKLFTALKIGGVIWILIFALLVLIWLGTRLFTPKRPDLSTNLEVVYVDLEEKLEELGATNIDMDIDSGGNHIYFTIGGIESSLTSLTNISQSDTGKVGDTVLYFFVYDKHYLDELTKTTLSKDEVEAFSYRPINAFLYDEDDNAKVMYYDKSRNMYVTDTMVRCIDYAGFVGEFYQKQSGEYHAVYDDIGIWLNGDEPADYDYD
ncbi:hypothetical protein IKW75_03435 [Candidatus Saccharibacteria bacterium]|nr:hypothetical protein [Candidatus Saccharibacteria bacterium]